ncbi:MAG: hypothetical protein HN551_06115, partial [Tateyamaria sp.]|nr:hypothetical protein [Tateyamaria sp.]
TIKAALAFISVGVVLPAGCRRIKNTLGMLSTASKNRWLLSEWLIYLPPYLPPVDWRCDIPKRDRPFVICRVGPVV